MGECFLVVAGGGGGSMLYLQTSKKTLDRGGHRRDPPMVAPVDNRVHAFNSDFVARRSLERVFGLCEQRVRPVEHNGGGVPL